MVEPPIASAGADTISYSSAAQLSVVRAFVRARARILGLTSERADLLTLAVSELATNTLRHTNAGGRVRLWLDGARLTCDIVDSGPIRRVGHSMPAADAEGGRGLAIVERICDEVTTTATGRGTLVRLRFVL
jgi:serine/threonine-protein kinase RsbW